MHDRDCVYPCDDVTSSQGMLQLITAFCDVPVICHSACVYCRIIRSDSTFRCRGPVDAMKMFACGLVSLHAAGMECKGNVTDHALLKSSLRKKPTSAGPACAFKVILCSRAAFSATWWCVLQWPISDFATVAVAVDPSSGSSSNWLAWTRADLVSLRVQVVFLTT